MKGIPPETIIATLALMQEAREAIERADPLSNEPTGLSARLARGAGALRGYLIANLPERIQLRDAA
jgi:hypothetical protein